MVRYQVEFKQDHYTVVDKQDNTIVFKSKTATIDDREDATVVADDWNFANSFPRSVACEFDN